jgi:hypothetical protein
MNHEDIHEINASIRKQGGEPFEYWDDAELKKKLANAEQRWRTHKRDGNWPEWRSRQVKIDGTWYDLCRTDLCDDIRTWGLIPLAPSPPAELANTAQVNSECHTYGARVTADTIYVIDSLSDG